MPLYDYKCPLCGDVSTEYMKMCSAGDAPAVICHCDNFTACERKVSLPRTNMTEFATPIEMESIAMNHRDDILEFKRQCPDVDCSLDENDPLYGVPIARTRQQKLAALKVAGFAEAK